MSRLVALSEISEVVRGVTFSREDTIANPREGYVAILRAGNIQDHLILDDDLVWLPKEQVSPIQFLKKNDLVMCTSSGSADLVGKLAPVLIDNWNGSFGAFCAVIRPNEQECFPAYLKHFLKSKKFRQWTKQSQGANIKNIRKSELESYQLLLPNIEEQKRIAAILDKTDSLFRKRQQAIQLADDFLRATFLDMFGDPGTNPKKWQEGIIRDLVTTVNYGSSDKADETKGEYPILRMMNITYEGRWDFTSLKYIDLTDSDKEKYLAKPGDLLFNRTNSKELVGKTAVFEEDKVMVFAGYLIRVRTNERANPYFISAYLNSEHGKQTLFSMAKSIVGMANINAQELQNIKIQIPPIELQNKYAEIVAAVRKREKKMIFSEEEISKLNLALVDRLLS